MPRFFTIQQAQGLLPGVEAAIRDATFLKSELDAAEIELRSTFERITMMGGAHIDRDHLAGQKKRREQSATQLKEAIEKIQSYGCQVKDLDIGLIDFPSLYHGQEVCLCWKIGEAAIEYWHGVTEGFRGRKKIDREFLDNHRGDRTN